MKDHFDEIAAGYDSEIPEAIRLHLLDKKCDFMHRRLLAYDGSTESRLRGLDVGCGTGHYLHRMNGYGYDMNGIDTSEGMLAQARKNSNARTAAVVKGSALALPFEDNSFDFSYIINVLHHLNTREEQLCVLGEIARVVKPGGLFFVHEMNADNAVFRFYMNVIFPLTNRIDGDRPDLWVAAEWLRRTQIFGVQLQEMLYFTFIPNCIPKSWFPAAAKIEALLERLTAGRLGAHCMFVLRKQKKTD
jgi:ubiquinone/menaquinone biosynthesis C-methylase UbiE